MKVLPLCLVAKASTLSGAFVTFELCLCLSPLLLCVTVLIGIILLIGFVHAFFFLLKN